VQDFLTIIYILFLLQVFVPLLQKRLLQGLRVNAIRSLESKRRSRVITMIHRQETMNLLGFPIARYIDIEDSEKVLRAIRLTPPEMPIDIILHTPGGLVLAAEQIALALKRHRGTVTVFIPHYAMSGGTLIALAADGIVMDPNAVLGPVDPQLGSPQGGYFPAASVLAALQTPNPNREDQTLIMGDVARKAIDQVERSVRGLLREHYTDADAAALARALSEGRWTHDYPIDYEEAKDLGLRVSEEMPEEIYRLMDLYPQARQQRPGVEYIPTPYRSAPAPGARERRE
jgi:ClpP class serine protease